MTYNSVISFTLDTVCPWTYLAKRHLDAALKRFRETHSSAPITFTVKYLPYQLSPESSKEGVDKFTWYRDQRFGGSEERMGKYMALMTAYGRNCGIEFKYGGLVANTIDAHRVIRHFQEKGGPECADAIINSLYSQYFENEKHPSSKETLLTACEDASIPETEARPFIEDEFDGLLDTKMLIREQEGNGISAVPYVVIEGKKRDLTLTGSKEEEEYYKSLEQIMKESV